VSLIDVVLQLVIFFVLTSTFKISEVSIDISLPPADAPAAAQEEGITIELDDKGNIRLGGEEVTKESLGEYFRIEAERQRDRVIFLRADKAAAHGEVVAVLDLARANDMRRLSVAAVSREGERDD
jgi:biopolymer transport protein ExbD